MPNSPEHDGRLLPPSADGERSGGIGNIPVVDMPGMSGRSRHNRGITGGIAAHQRLANPISQESISVSRQPGFFTRLISNWGIRIGGGAAVALGVAKLEADVRHGQDVRNVVNAGEAAVHKFESLLSSPASNGTAKNPDKGTQTPEFKVGDVVVPQAVVNEVTNALKSPDPLDYRINQNIDGQGTSATKWAEIIGGFTDTKTGKAYLFLKNGSSAVMVQLKANDKGNVFLGTVIIPEGTDLSNLDCSTPGSCPSVIVKNGGIPLSDFMQHLNDASSNVSVKGTLSSDGRIQATASGANITVGSLIQIYYDKNGGTAYSSSGNILYNNWQTDMRKNSKANGLNTDTNGLSIFGLDNKGNLIPQAGTPTNVPVISPNLLRVYPNVPIQGINGNPSPSDIDLSYNGNLN